MEFVKAFVKKGQIKLKELGPLKSVGLISGLYVGYMVTTFTAVYIYQKSLKYSTYTTGDDICKGMDLSGKTFIITGSSAGLGKETARIILKYGGTVIMANRNETKSIKAINELKADLSSKHNINIMDNKVLFYQIDLSSLESCYKFANIINKSDIKCDYLINNAGVAALPEYKTTKDGIEWQFGINHIGHYYMTKLLLPKLIKDKTRIVNLTSWGHWFGGYKKSKKLIDYCIQKRSYMADMSHVYSPFFAYGISKASNILFTKWLNKNYNSQGIYSVAAHPGSIPETELGRHVVIDFSMIWMTLKALFVTPWFLPYDSKGVPAGVSTTLRACFVTNEYITNNGSFYRNAAPASTYKSSMASHDDMIAKIIGLSDILIKDKGFKLSLE